VTRELEAGEQVIRWRVPNLPARSARIRVRFERGEHEIEGPPSAAFQIVACGGEQDLQAFHEGNWWEGMELRSERPRASLTSDDVPVLSAGTAAPVFEIGAPPASPTRPAASRLTANRGPATNTPTSLAIPTPSQRFLPLRN
jgi:hypothetical protein